MEERDKNNKLKSGGRKFQRWFNPRLMGAISDRVDPTQRMAESLAVQGREYEFIHIVSPLLARMLSGLYEEVKVEQVVKGMKTFKLPVEEEDLTRSIEDVLDTMQEESSELANGRTDDWYGDPEEVMLSIEVLAENEEDFKRFLEKVVEDENIYSSYSGMVEAKGQPVCQLIRKIWIG